MDNQSDHLFDEIRRRGLNIAKFSRITGIPVERVYQWKNGNGKPKAEDAGKIAEWMGKTEKVTESATQPETNTLGVIKDLAESNKIIAESNRTLARSHEELVKLLKANSGNQDSEENQLIILAYQKVMFRYMARFGATAEGREPGVVLNEMGKTLAESLKVGVKGGKVGSSSDKA